MCDISPAPSIAVTIGDQLRVYYAYVTTAGPELDGPSTVTLYASTLIEVAGFAADAIIDESVYDDAPARLVLIDLKELAWHRARYEEADRLFAAADPVLGSLNILQRWLWLRLQTPTPSEARSYA